MGKGGGKMIVLKITCKKCGSVFVITNSFRERLENLKCPSCGMEFTKEASDSLKDFFEAEIKLRKSLTPDKDIIFELVSNDYNS